MGHQQQSDTASHSNGLPAKLPALDAILPRDMEWIVEYQPGDLEADAVFAQIDFALGMIPCEQQS
jgi:hypothetical protein